MDWNKAVSYSLEKKPIIRKTESGVDQLTIERNISGHKVYITRWTSEMGFPLGIRDVEYKDLVSTDWTLL